MIKETLIAGLHCYKQFIQPKKTRQFHNGYSLIEMVIVIAIMSILTATTLPKFVGMVNKTKETSIKAMAHSLELAIESYKSIYNAFPEADSIESLQNQLITAKIVTSHMENPFTNKPFSTSDSDGKIIISSSSENDTYHIQAYSKKNETVLVDIKSD